jgi:membrane-associated phospholipid phosphatase
VTSSGEGRVANDEGSIRESVFSNPLPVRLLSLACSCTALVLTFIGLFEWDVPLTRFIRSLKNAQTDDLANPWLAHLSNFGDRLGNGESLVIISLVIGAIGLLLKSSDWKEAGWKSLLAHGIAGVISNLTKHLVGRPRPKFMHAGQLELSPVSGSGWDSFPSGHSTASFAVATVLAVKFPKFRYVILLFPLAIAASRIVRGSHYLTDAAGGALLGYLIGSVAANPWREWRSSLESALFATAPVLAAVLAIVWTIGHHPSDLWPAPQLMGAGLTIVLLGLVGHAVIVARPTRLPPFFTRPVAQGLIGFGLGMFTGSPWVTTTVLLVCAAYWLRCWTGKHSMVSTSKTVSSCSIFKEALFVLAILSALVLGFELRGALPML